MDPFSRRDALKGGGLLATAWLLAGTGGCQSGSQSAGLPTPVTPGEPPLVKPQPITAYKPPVYTPPPAPVPQPAPVPSAPSGVMPRSAWTRAGVARARDINPMNGVTRITVHHDGMNVFTSTGEQAAAGRIEQIRVSHVNGRGWADIGYHYIIDPAGRVWTGRAVIYQGAHVQDQNEHNLGIMCLGNFNQQKPSPQQLAALDSFLAAQMRQYRVPLGRVYTHREIGQSECPGRSMQSHMVQARGRNGALAMAARAAGLWIA